MELFRLTPINYSCSLSGSGVEHRWNRNGEYVLYCSASKSACEMEIAANRTRTGITYCRQVIFIPDAINTIEQIHYSKLPIKWKSITSWSQLHPASSLWYTNKEYLVLKVPSAVTDGEFNYIINCSHPNFKQNLLIEVQNIELDRRLFP